MFQLLISAMAPTKRTPRGGGSSRQSTRQSQKEDTSKGTQQKKPLPGHSRASTSSSSDEEIEQSQEVNPVKTFWDNLIEYRHWETVSMLDLEEMYKKLPAFLDEVPEEGNLEVVEKQQKAAAKKDVKPNIAAQKLNMLSGDNARAQGLLDYLAKTSSSIPWVSTITITISIT